MLDCLPLEVLISIFGYLDNPRQVLMANKQIYKTRTHLITLRNGIGYGEKMAQTGTANLDQDKGITTVNNDTKISVADFVNLFQTPHTLLNGLTTIEYDTCLSYATHLLTLPKPMDQLKTLLTHLPSQYHNRLIQSLVYSCARTGSLHLKDLLPLGEVTIPFQILSQDQLFSLLDTIDMEEATETILQNDFDLCLKSIIGKVRVEEYHLHQAVLANSFRCVQLLLEVIKPSRGCIYDAVGNGYTRIVYLMIKAGVDGQEVLYEALRMDQVGIVQMLCALGLCRVDARALGIGMSRTGGMRVGGKTGFEYLVERCDVLKVLGVSKEAFGILCKYV